ncbi:MAG: phosphoribosyltransferase [Sphaerochaetaceae bacterium]|nr:phosphoribosyltransferase [Sphaerochaetaceae bacterium]
MSKDFIRHDVIRDSALKLAYKMYKEDNFIPDVIYVSLRGGVYMGNVMSEFYKLVCKNTKRRPVLYAAVVARSRYATVPGEETKVFVDGWTYSPDYLRYGDKVLLVDDIFDTGNTVNKLAEVIMDKGIPREDLKIAVYDYKVPQYKYNDEFKPLPIQPDYYCRKHVLNSPADETWIHYLCHEYVGLTNDEIDEVYKDEEVRQILHELKA